MKNGHMLLAAALAAILALWAHVPTGAQVISVLDTLGGGAVTTMDEGTVGEWDYAATGILSEWSILLEDFEHYDGDDELDTMAGGKRKTQVLMHDLQGRLVNLPSVIDENGVDIYLLTTEGITVYLGLDAPVYHQEPDREIIKWIRYYAHEKRSYTQRIFKRYEQWSPRLKKYFKAVGVPPELTELCLIESGCTYGALSPAGAVGMWQIMPATGRHYGMTVNEARDDRKDPVLSTQVAARILSNNHDRTGDWTLAAAAYNCGAGRVEKAIRRGLYGWTDVKGTLPGETQRYIPALIAIHYVWTYREKLGFN